MISKEYPPRMGATAIRASAIAGFFSSKGHHVTVLTEKIETTGADYSSNVFFDLIEEKRLKTWFNFFRYLKWIGIGGNSYWLIQVFTKGSRILRDDYPLMYSLGFPYVAHVICLILSFFKKKTMWVADFTDPWAYHPSNKNSIKRLLLSAIEKRILKKANLIVVNSKMTRELYIRKYGALKDIRDKIMLVYNGCEYSDRPANEKINKNKQEFVISFVGNIQGEQVIDNLVIALDKFTKANPKVILNWVGRFINDSGKRNERKLKRFDNIRYIEQLSPQESYLLCRGSDLLLLPCHNGFQIPAKLAVYLQAGKPILVIENVPNDEVSGIVTRYRKGMVVENSAYQIENCLSGILSDFKKGLLEAKYNKDPIYDFSWENQCIILWKGISLKLLNDNE